MLLKILSMNFYNLYPFIEKNQGLAWSTELPILNQRKISYVAKCINAPHRILCLRIHHVRGPLWLCWIHLYMSPLAWKLSRSIYWKNVPQRKEMILGTVLRMLFPMITLLRLTSGEWLTSSYSTSCQRIYESSSIWWR